MNLAYTASWALLLGVLAVDARAVPSIVSGVGIVQFRLKGYENWQQLVRVPTALAPGDAVRTGGRSSAAVSLDDGSRVELSENSVLNLEKIEPQGSRLRLPLGRLKALVQRLGTRRFEIYTPTAVCAVRGTEFELEVGQGGETMVMLRQGLLAVEDLRGSQVLLRPGESVRVDDLGLGPPREPPTRAQLSRSRLKEELRRELGLDLSKEALHATAAREVKLEQFQLGRALIDTAGRRVRLEEYVVRNPQTPRQFKLVVLNGRLDQLQYFFFNGTFNQDLPLSMGSAFRQLPGGLDTAPSFFLTAYTAGWSNGQDSIRARATGGHLVDVNANGNPNDAVTAFYNSGREGFDSAVGRPVFQSLFNNYGLYLNGALKFGWESGANIACTPGGACTGVVPTLSSVSGRDPFTGTSIPGGVPTQTTTTTFPEAGSIHQVFQQTYSDGTSTVWSNFAARYEGDVATTGDFQNQTSGAGYRRNLLGVSYEQVIGSSEFAGRKIDLVLEPKILLQTGLLQ